VLPADVAAWPAGLAAAVGGFAVEEAVAASLTGDFTQSRRTMAHLDRVSDRLRTLDGRVAEDMASLGKANFVLLERALKLDELDRELAACYGRRVRLPPSGKYVCSRRGESRHN
jgi:hypothetical protein